MASNCGGRTAHRKCSNGARAGNCFCNRCCMHGCESCLMCLPKVAKWRTSRSPSGRVVGSSHAFFHGECRRAAATHHPSLSTSLRHTRRSESLLQSKVCLASRLFFNVVAPCILYHVKARPLATSFSLPASLATASVVCGRGPAFQVNSARYEQIWMTCPSTGYWQTPLG